MDSTRLSLLMRAKSGSQGAWNELVTIYRPMVVRWLEHQRVNHSDAEEVAQEVMSVLVAEIENFSHAIRTIMDESHRDALLQRGGIIGRGHATLGVALTICVLPFTNGIRPSRQH